MVARHQETGMVTVELAIGMMSVLLVLSAVVGFFQVGIAHMNACEVARIAARDNALFGGGGADASGTAVDADISVSRAGRQVTAHSVVAVHGYASVFVGSVECTMSTIAEDTYM